MPVIAASYLGPALQRTVMQRGKRRNCRKVPMGLCRKLWAADAARRTFYQGSVLRSFGLPEKCSAGGFKGEKKSAFSSHRFGNVDEILPFITQVFKHECGFPSPNQFANSVSNAAAFFLARICEINGVVLTISQEELSFESALWLAQSYLAGGQIDLALVGGCDVFTPSVDDYRARMNLSSDNSRNLPVGEGSSWLLLGDNGGRLGDIIAVRFSDEFTAPKDYSVNTDIENDWCRIY